MKFTPKYFLHILAFVIIIVIFIQPAVIFGVQDLTPKDFYPDDSIIITTAPSATYPDDLRYCYQGQNTITATVVFYNQQDGNPSWIVHSQNELKRANITLNIVNYHWINETSTNFYDFEYETRMTEIREGDNADLVLSFANLMAMPSDLYGGLVGYARIQFHISIVLMKNSKSEQWGQSIILHEISHCLGYIPEPTGHSSDQNSIMYKIYSGKNNYFNDEDIQILSDLH